MIENRCDGNHQRGISIVIVLFLLVVVSGLVISVTQLTGTQHINTVFAYRSSQSYFAARAGLDYAISRVVNGNGCTLDSPLAIAGYNVAVACVLVGTFNEGNAAAPYGVYTLTARAGGGGFSLPDAANREVRATVKFP
jgi:MSHA biogenesis protein MshP